MADQVRHDVTLVEAFVCILYGYVYISRVFSTFSVILVLLNLRYIIGR